MNDHIKQKLKLKLYKSLVKPILIYNAGIRGVTQSEEQALDSFNFSLN